MTLYVIRHGETDWNKERRIQGLTDIPLNDFGRYLARETAKGLRDIPFDLCYSSPLNRAVETAQIVLGDRQVRIVKDERLIEMSYGKLEGHFCSGTNWDVPETFSAYFHDPENYAPEADGETFASVIKRMTEAIGDMAGGRENQEKTILVCTHGASIAALLCGLRGLPIARIWDGGVHKNCGVTKISSHQGRLKIEWEDRVFYEDEVEAWG